MLLRLALAAALTLSGCSAPAKFYRLSADGPAPATATGIAVGLGPVRLPTYIDRASLVFQSGDNQFEMPTNASWTGSLQDNVTRVLADDVARRIGSGNVVAFPWSVDAKLRYRISVDIKQFHAISGKGAILEATWSVMGDAGAQPLWHRSGNFEEPISGDGYDAVAGAESRLLARLAGEIAQSLPRR